MCVQDCRIRVIDVALAKNKHEWKCPACNIPHPAHHVLPDYQAVDWDRLVDEEMKMAPGVCIYAYVANNENMLFAYYCWLLLLGSFQWPGQCFSRRPHCLG